MEKDLEDAILRELENFLLELGDGFTFQARQYRMQIDSDDFSLDLLFYLRWLAKHEQQPGELPPLGLILCAGKKQEQIELLELDASGIHIADYITGLPDRKLLAEKLHAAIEISKARFNAKGLPGLWQTLEKLPRHQWPTLTRGDCGDGWQALETTIRLSGWTRERRVVLVRESPSRAPVARIDKPRLGKDRQTTLPHAQGEGWDAQATPWSGKIAVLVTSLDSIAFPTSVMPKHYRDRADAENCFDELKNQWCWGGYTSRKLAPSRLMAQSHCAVLQLVESLPELL